MPSDTTKRLLDGRRVAVIGAGPVGLEAALYASGLGAEVCVYERGDPAQQVADWGHIEMFTPFGLNHTTLGRAALESAGIALPDDETFQTGGEWRETYLLPLARSTALAEGLLTGTRVVTVGRSGLLKGDHIGDGERAHRPFRLLLETADGAERYDEADTVLDCSGSWGKPNWLGQDGVPAVGERALRQRIAYHPLDVSGSLRDEYAGRRTLLVGDGLSAATTAVALAGLAEAVPGTELIWVTRPARAVPISLIPDDSLPRRDWLARQANRLATTAAPGVRWLPGSVVESLAPGEGESLVVTLRTREGRRVEPCDRVIANVGYEPDDSLYRELQVHECYASRAPMKLAASLLAAEADAGGDCLKLGGFGPEVLANPEPEFYILGMKSYGRNSAFLLRTGHEQVRDVFRLLTDRDDLDLYGMGRNAGSK